MRNDLIRLEKRLYNKFIRKLISIKIIKNLLYINLLNPQKNFFNSIIPSFLSGNSLDFQIFPPTNYSIINATFNVLKTKCPICLIVPKALYRPNSCSHYFCKTCLKKWINIKKNCPICRRTFNEIIKI